MAETSTTDTTTTEPTTAPDYTELLTAIKESLANIEKAQQDGIEPNTKFQTDITKSVKAIEDKVTAPVEPTPEGKDYTTVLGHIDQRLSNLEGIQTDSFKFGHDATWLLTGLFVGIIGGYILIRKALEKWGR